MSSDEKENAQQATAVDLAWKSPREMDVDGSDEYEPSEHQTEPPSVGGGDHESNDGEEEEDDDDYDPESIPIPENPSEMIVKSKSQTKTSGGFILEVSDDENGDEEENNASSEQPKTANQSDHDEDLHEPEEPAEESQSNEIAEQELQRNEGSKPLVTPNVVDADHPVESVETAEDSQEPEESSPGPKEAGSPSQAKTASSQPQEHPAPIVPSMTFATGAPITIPAQSIAALEVRLKEDSRGDMDAWLSLIAQYRLLNNIDDLRKTYERFLEVFPQCAAGYVEWLEMELSLNNFSEAERIFNVCLVTITDVDLWTVYLNYIRRRNDLTNDTNGQARKVVAQAYDYVMDKVGLDKDSGKLWIDYIQFLRSGPGQLGGTTWQDQQKADQLRKAYQRAISVPTSVVNTMWKEYDQFEMGLNKMNGRKFIQEHSPSYMTAKGAYIALESLTRNLSRNSYPRLPPAAGFDGHTEFMEQVDLWNKWIEWEKSDPLVLEEEDNDAFKKRILHVYNQALMALRFCPKLWADCSDWCFANNILHVSTNTSMGMFILTQGRIANPESVLLALKHADRIESTPHSGDDDPNKAKFAAAVREPYNAVLDTLYEMCTSLKEKESSEIARLEQLEAAKEASGNQQPNPNFPQEPTREQKTQFIKDAYSTRIQLLNRTISFVWIALVRAMRRIQGKGGAHSGGLRQAFTDARTRGRLTSEVYVAVALLEAVVYKDPVGGKIFERGARLFPEDEVFMLEYLKYLHSKDDTTNARVVFETCVNRLTQKPETIYKAKSLYQYFHNYESHYGELSQISKLEERMAELFPEDPKLTLFHTRFVSDRADKFDPLSAQIIVSPAVQQRPKIQHMMEMPPSSRETPAPGFRMEASPGPQYMRATNSPKRPYPNDEMEDNRPRKFARGDSPLKGAAGRRLDQQRRVHGSTLHRDITFLLTLLPPAASFDAYKVNPSSLISLLTSTSVPDFHTWKSSQDPMAATRPVPAGPVGTHRYNTSQSGFSYGEYDGGSSRRGHQPGSYRQQADEQYRYQY
ncbi:mRNA 3'-end-processing protein RNA14 [Ceratocystis fimbriata CBS 114723]|uniref:mRNA 3'-end-processing protein RNA14 n=1 Tax=Ceratocystis fimbriata CBS 114723 TaxID=1035309 RepID=A0A2C5W7F3_9PEZI|nr:mRNA 3'-end-processing protein RNA14 [Ceratocystis fimbriata CBS 114723]